MIDPKNINISQLPKKFVDGALGSHGKEGFSFVFTSGNELHSFMSTPIIMKSILDWMTKQIEEYEKQFGVIDTSVPPILSPLQKSDLGEGESK